LNTLTSRAAELGVGSVLPILQAQWAGIALFALLFFFLYRNIRRRSLEFWAFAWLSLTVARGGQIASALAGFRAWPIAAILYFGDYLFVLLVWMGCRIYRLGRTPLRGLAFAIVSAVAVAATLAQLAPDAARIPHDAIVGAALLTMLITERAAWRKSRAGARLLALALALMSFNDFRDAVIRVLAPGSPPPLPVEFRPVVEVILQVLLGFAMVTVVMEQLLAESEAANRGLEEAHERMKELARQDALTQTLNRHALYSLLEDQRAERGDETGGCAVILDIDGLKQINDTFGHASGDAAIRAVAHAIRGRIRPDDLLFRWGGDEFLVLLYRVDEEAARGRFAGLNLALHPVSVSFGLSEFSRERPLARAIETADAAMYESKRRMRRNRATAES
jgi:diguanylate cyclase (GGDEF)-like protein